MGKAKVDSRAIEHVKWCERMRRKVDRKTVAIRLGLSVATITKIANDEITHTSLRERRAKQWGWNG